MNLLTFVKKARAENPKALLTKDEVAACLYRAAQMAQAAGHDVGLLLKPGGNGGQCPLGRISLDILIDIPDEQEYDAFASADGKDGGPGPAKPVWSKLPFKVGKCAMVNGVRKCSGAKMENVRRPLGTVPGPSPTPTPTHTPPPSGDSVAKCAADLRAIASRLDALTNK